MATSKQKAFILWVTTWGNEKGDVQRESNVDKLNKLLSDGWRVEKVCPMSGHGEDDDETRCLVIVEK